MTLVSKPEVKSIKIKKDTKEVKFKAKTESTLYTLVVKDLEKASKIESNMKSKSSISLSCHVVFACL